MAGVLSVAWQRYLDNLKKHPLQTKSLTSATLAGLSNVIAQRMLSNASLNWRRAFAMAAFGFFVGAPATHYWHQFLEKLFPRSKKDDLAPLKKVLLDLVTFGPLYNLAALTYISSVVDGRSLAFTKRKVQQEFPSVVLSGLKVWPLVHLINYKYTPPHLRVPFVSVASLFWSVYLILRAKGTLSIKPRP